jgi:anti-sigma-K factor RskA
MSQTSRRSFLAAAGAGTAATAVAGPAAGVSPATFRGAEPLVAHVRDPATGTVVLYVGDREVVVHDHDLVRRLNRAAGL